VNSADFRLALFKIYLLWHAPVSFGILYKP
jgi:hypothetical protein